MNKSVMLIVVTYNHKKYIRQCLDSILSQKRNFNLEVLVHDDASTDGTADIVREYEYKYPQIIKGIYQTENKLKKGDSINKTHIIPTLSAKKIDYFAMVEGDDWLCDDNKLQRQFDILDRNPETIMCLHKVVDTEENGTYTNCVYPGFELKTGDYSGDDIIEMVCKERYPFQSSSYFFRADYYFEYFNEWPNFSQSKGFGDIQKLLWMSLKGKAFYINEVMSCHRQNYSSVSNQWRNNEKKINHLKKTIQMMKEFDEYSEYKFHTSCDFFIRNREYKLAFFSNNHRMLIKSKYKEFLKRDFNIKSRCVLYIKAFLCKQKRDITDDGIR